ncbi:prephenate dehydrogenase [Paramicrobacterium humi]|uniref:Prephenate dehydrogenase n=1 Tax=Paramicrobacterium humi TaxID=640635 RepID=A0A1H4PYQ5_9MICO|nr:prephenate dehydrogenase [Microbacterium humi]SEC12461.1 prephenate dehydrogenase [Microbacterium humi]
MSQKRAPLVDPSKNLARFDGHVRIVGTGLLGASIGLALTGDGLDVALADASPSQLRLAVDYGAGRPAAETDDPDLIIVAVPPDVTADVIAAELERYPRAVVTDVASIKSEPFIELTRRGLDLTNYIGSHPMAGRERGGAISARADLFVGRPWVICRDESTPRQALALIEDLALDLGAVPIEMTPDEHDDAVGLISHVPQLVSSLLAARLVDAPDAALRLTGQGLRDTVRIASSQPELWVQILGANAAPVADVLTALRKDLDSVIDALEHPDARGSRRHLADAIAAGNIGVARLPGKHGQDQRFAQIVVMVDDRPGELGRLLTELGEINVNMEDLRLEHSPGTAVGLAEISVLPEVKQRTIEDLEARGWRIASV